MSENINNTLHDSATNIRKYAISERVQQLLPGFDAPFFQAGLDGYTDVAMRVIARQHGCPYCITEALLDRLLIAGGKGFRKADLRNLVRIIPQSEHDHPLAGQIIGSMPDEMAQAAKLLADTGYDVIDVNLACPVKKIGRKQRGGHFLAYPQQAIQVLEAVREAVPVDIPTTVKLRRGYDDSEQAAQNFEEIFCAVYELGYAWSTVHCRTVKQKYNGPGQWDFLRDLTSRHPEKVIFGSGDIWEANDIFRMLDYTGVHAVSVARGCIGNPWIFRQARQIMAGENPLAPSITDQREVLLQHFELCCAEHGEKLAGRLMRKFGIMFSKHHPDADNVKVQFTKIVSFDQWRQVIDNNYG